MRYLKLLFTAMIAIASLAAGTASSSASPLTSPEGTPYTSTLKAESEGSTSLEGAFTTVTCQKSTFEGKVETHNNEWAEGKLSSLTLGECNFPVTVNKFGSLRIRFGGASYGTVISSGAEVSIATSVGTCVFTTSSTDIGALTNSNLTGGNATLDLNSAKIPRTGGNFLCGSTGTWTGSYKITTPSTLYVDPPVSPLTSPASTPYTGTIKAESSGVSFTFPFVSLKCSSSALEGRVDSHAAGTATIQLESLTFAACSFPTSAPKMGPLTLDATTGGNATVASSGTEIKIAAGGGEGCSFTTSGTHLGTLAGSNSSNAEFIIKSAAFPGKPGCPLGSPVVWDGLYKITTPSTLYFD
jgi:hypothetical protein